MAIPASLMSLLPGPKTTLTLYELSATNSDSMTPIETWTAIQTLDGSLQPLSAKESIEYNKETLIANFKFIVATSCFANSTNEAKLVSKNQLRSTTRTFDIVFNGARPEAMIPHYSVILKEVT
jgi:head-tail adaptor